LTRPNAGDHVDAELLRGVHGGATDATKRPRYDESLPRFRTSGLSYKLVAGQCDKWNRCGVDQVDAFG
jgi:hypothetical protein